MEGIPETPKVRCNPFYYRFANRIARATPEICGRIRDVSLSFCSRAPHVTSVHTHFPAAGPSKEFDYLLQMPLASLTAEKVASLRSELAKHEQALAELHAKSEADLWLADLDELDKALA